jgi:DNA-binding CsgD family transcriptional regulator
MPKTSSRRLNSSNRSEREQALKQVRILEAGERVATLTQRERQVLCGLLAGHHNKTIAYQLGISARTTEVHRIRMMRRLGAHSLAEAVMIGITGGVLNREADSPFLVTKRRDDSTVPDGRREESSDLVQDTTPHPGNLAPGVVVAR